MLGSIFIMEVFCPGACQHLDHPSLEMLRRTSQGLRDLPTDRHIQYTFLDFTVYYLDVGSIYEKIPCRKFPGLESEDSHTLEQTGFPLKKCKWAAGATRSSDWVFWKFTARSRSATFCRAIPLTSSWTSK